MESCSFSFKQKIPKLLSQNIPLKDIKLPNYSNKNIKYQNLFSQKSFLEVILDLIKKSQLNYLNMISNKNIIKKCDINNKKKESIILTKKALLSLKNNLCLIKKEKLNSLNYFKDQNNEKEKNIYYIQKNNKINKEINQLKDMNFICENKIQKIDNLIKSRDNYMFLVKNYNCFLELYSEHFCRTHKKYEEIKNIYNEEIINDKKDLNEIIVENFQRQKKIKEINSRIDYLSNILNKEKKILYNNDTIKEDTKEYINSGSNKNNIQIQISIKKKVNFSEKVNSKFRNNIKDNNYSEKLKLKKTKKIIDEQKILKHRFSYPDIKLIPNLKKNKLFPEKIYKSFCKNYLINNNKNICVSDFDKTTISTLNDKTIESEYVLNNTL